MKGFFRGFVYAGRGLWFCIRHERNFRVHMAAGGYVLVLAPYFLQSRGEWAALLAAVALVLAAEALNTAVEQAVNLASAQRRVRARVAKDVAAGAVLLCALFAAAIGAVLFVRPDGWARLLADWRLRLWKPAALAASAPLALGFIVCGGRRRTQRKNRRRPRKGA